MCLRKQEGDSSGEAVPLAEPTQSLYNLAFYRNDIPSKPQGARIEIIHNDWYDDYDGLERNHHLIEWLFPTTKVPQGSQAHPLQPGEADEIISDQGAMDRVKMSYMMMLHFYGMKLRITDDSGKVERGSNWEERFRHLNNYPERITRMLTSLGLLGLERLKPPFLKFVLGEVAKTKELGDALASLRDVWIDTLASEDDKRELRRECYLHTFVQQPQLDRTSSKAHVRV